MLPPNPTTAPRGGGVWREDVALERIAAVLASSPAAPVAPFGDDAVVLARPAGEVVVCTDAAVAGVHLDVAAFPIEDLGYRAAIATLSDLAAVGATPLAALVALCAPGELDVVALEEACVSACATAGCPVVGGDLSRSATPTVVVSAVGVPPGRTVPRDGAAPGDALFVTGPLGAAAAGLRRRREGAGLADPLVLAHRRPRARLAEGTAAAASGASAMLDVSDGLARDLRRLAVASGVGVELEVVPVAEGATEEEALGGGEDYELVVAHRDAAALTAAFASAGLAAPLRVGTVVATPGCRLRGEELPELGWHHGGAGGPR